MNTRKWACSSKLLNTFSVRSWARELPTDLTYDKLLDKAKSHKTLVPDHHDEETHFDSAAFPLKVSSSIDAICPQ